MRHDISSAIDFYGNGIEADGNKYGLDFPRGIIHAFQV